MILLAVLLPFSAAVSPTVDLGYSKYKGNILNNGVSEWLGVRYAAAPVKDLRFKLPEDPVRMRAVQDATKVGHATPPSVQRPLLTLCSGDQYASEQILIPRSLAIVSPKTVSSLISGHRQKPQRRTSFQYISISKVAASMATQMPTQTALLWSLQVTWI
jgi:hypothetical protein